MVESLDALTMRHWAVLACEAMGEAAAEIDALNVYPVPDGDTGTNLYLTLRSALAALDPEDGHGALAPTLDRLARGALLGARGNSGVIISQVLRGLAESLQDASPADGPALAAALSHASDLAYAAVADPVEGTILTVARAAANAALRAVTSSGSMDVARVGQTAVPGALVEVARAAANAAATALAVTPSQLAALAQAGVVDAGGRGLCVVLDALLAAIAGQEGAATTTVTAAAPATGKALAVARGGRPDELGHAPSGHGQVSHPQFGYEVQFLLDQADEVAVAGLRRELSELGDSLAIVGTGKPFDELWNVHIHVNDVGAAVEAGVRAGRPHSIKVTRFSDQMCAPGTAAGARAGVRPKGTTWAGRGLVAVAPGPGLAGLFAGEGVVVVDGGPSRWPSVSEVLAAIGSTGAAEVVVLPNHATMTAVADAAADQARAAGQDVAVVPTRSPVQGLAAIAVADPSRRFGDVVIALAEAAAATRWAEVTVAAAEAMTSAGRCVAGDVLGLVEGDVVLIGDDQVTVACHLIDRLLSAGGELVTLVLGADAVVGFSDQVRAHVRRSHPGVDVMDYRGDQPYQPVLIGAE